MIVHEIRTRLWADKFDNLFDIREERYLLFGLVPIWVTREYRRVK